MKHGTLIRQGTSLMVVVPRKYCQARGWMAGDKLVIELAADHVRISNFDRKQISFTRDTADYGDAVSRRA